MTTETLETPIDARDFAEIPAIRSDLRAVDLATPGVMLAARLCETEAIEQVREEFTESGFVVVVTVDRVTRAVCREVSRAERAVRTAAPTARLEVQVTARRVSLSIEPGPTTVIRYRRA